MQAHDYVRLRVIAGHRAEAVGDRLLDQASARGLVLDQDHPHLERLTLPRAQRVILGYSMRLRSTCKLLFTGLRRAEAASPLWTTRTLARDGRLSGSSNEDKKKLDLPMSDVGRDRLVARRAIGCDGPFVFPSNSRNGYLSEPKVGLAAVVAATGIKASVHELRRSFITVAASAQMSPFALKALVNHSLIADRRRHNWPL